ncbi:MAG: Gx transporter family protein [Candidatus Latescibacteria bacterium]|nr:Gx transporter family protein [Candidatus Latescibacterota bacterium]
MRVHKLVSLALISAVGLILFSVEMVVPRPFPWMKLGLGNVAPLLALILYGGWEAAAVMAIKVGVGGFFTGVFLGPGFLMAAAGGCTAICCMGGVRWGAPGVFSVIGISVIGAIAHNLAQLGVAYLWFVGRDEVLSLFPMFLLSGLLAGLTIGLVAHVLVTRVEGVMGWRTGT